MMNACKIKDTLVLECIPGDGTVQGTESTPALGVHILCQVSPH